MQQQIKVGSIIEILNHDVEETDEEYATAYPIGSQWGGAGISPGDRGG